MIETLNCIFYLKWFGLGGGRGLLKFVDVGTNESPNGSISISLSLLLIALEVKSKSPSCLAKLAWDLGGKGGKGGAIVEDVGLEFVAIGIGGKGGGLVGAVVWICCFCGGGGGRGGGIAVTNGFIGSNESSNVSENVGLAFSA